MTEANPPKRRGRPRNRAGVKPERQSNGASKRPRAVLAGKIFKSICTDYGLLMGDVGAAANASVNDVSRFATGSTMIGHGTVLDIISALPPSARLEWCKKVFGADFSDSYVRIVPVDGGYRGSCVDLSDAIVGVSISEVAHRIEYALANSPQM